MSSIQKLQVTKTLILNIAKGIKNTESFDSFAKEDFSKLNKKLFVRISYFLVASINENYSKSLPWPILNNRQDDCFITELFKVIDVIRTDYPWANIPHYQRSHFLDPRSENDKVAEFLWKMTSITAYILADIRPVDKTLDELKNYSQELRQSREEKSKEIEKLKCELALLEEKMKDLSTSSIDMCQKLLKSGIISSPDDFNVSTLDKVQEILESKLIELIKELHYRSDNIR